MNASQKQFKERRIWYFACAKCGKSHRQSHKKKNATNQVCMKCRRIEVPKNQPKLFDEEILKHGLVGELADIVPYKVKQ